LKPSVGSFFNAVVQIKLDTNKKIVLVQLFSSILLLVYEHRCSDQKTFFGSEKE
jgi:hypothetical protein